MGNDKKDDNLSYNYYKNNLSGIIVRKPSELTEHLKNNDYFPDELLGEEDDELLLADIKANGIHDPLIINEDNVVLCGHRRLGVAKKLKLKSLQCRIYNRTSDKPEVYEKDEEEFMIKDNLLRRQLSNKTRNRLYKSLSQKELTKIILERFSDAEILQENRGKRNAYSNKNNQPITINEQIQKALPGASNRKITRAVADAKVITKNAITANRKLPKSVQRKVDAIENKVYNIKKKIENHEADKQKELNQFKKSLEKKYKPILSVLKKDEQALLKEKEKLLK